jgi:hypothetical protein
VYFDEIHDDHDLDHGHDHDLDHVDHVDDADENGQNVGFDQMKIVLNFPVFFLNLTFWKTLDHKIEVAGMRVLIVPKAVNLQ